MPADLRQGAQRLDHLRRDVAWMRAREADPLEALDGVQALQQPGEVAGGIVRRLVVVDDLAEQLDLFRARVYRMASLRDDVSSRAHPLVTARVRDHAERAELVA